MRQVAKLALKPSEFNGSDPPARKDISVKQQLSDPVAILRECACATLYNQCPQSQLHSSIDCPGQRRVWAPIASWARYGGATQAFTF